VAFRAIVAHPVAFLPKFVALSFCVLAVLVSGFLVTRWPWRPSWTFLPIPVQSFSFLSGCPWFGLVAEPVSLPFAFFFPPARPSTIVCAPCTGFFGSPQFRRPFLRHGSSCSLKGTWLLFFRWSSYVDRHPVFSPPGFFFCRRASRPLLASSVHFGASP